MVAVPSGTVSVLATKVFIFFVYFLLCFIMQLFSSLLLALFTFACCSMPPDAQRRLDVTVSHSFPSTTSECTGGVCPTNLKKKPSAPKAPINIVYHGRIPMAQGMQLMCVYDGINRKLHCISFFELNMMERQKKEKRNKI